MANQPNHSLKARLNRERAQAVLDLRKRSWPQRDDVISHWKKQQLPSLYPMWRDMTKEGDSGPEMIPYSYAREYMYIVNRNSKGDRPETEPIDMEVFFDLLISCDPVSSHWDELGKLRAAIEGNAETDRSVLRDRERMCARPHLKDMQAIADMVVTSFGAKIIEAGDPVDEEACRKRGVERMREHGWEPDQYAAWLLRMAMKNPRVVMLPEGPTGDGMKPIAVSVAVPVTKDAFFRFIDGKAADHDLTPDDFQSPSRYLLFQALAETGVCPHVDAEDLSLVAAHCLYYQIAYFTRREEFPVLAAPKTDKIWGDYMKQTGYYPSRNNMRGTDVPVMICGPVDGYTPPSGYEDALIRYQDGAGILAIYQEANREDWKAEDDAAGLT